MEKYHGQRIVVIASGDPLVAGIATNLIGLLGSSKVSVLPGVSSVSLARARMGWSAESCDVVPVVGHDHDVVRRFLSPGRRLVVLSVDGASPAEVASRLVDAGFGASQVVVLSDLGSAHERRLQKRAADWGLLRAPDVNVVCVECRPDGHAPALMPA